MTSSYLDNNATTPLDPAVVESMAPYLSARFGNPSSSHRLGREAHVALEGARQKVAHVLGSQPTEILFNSGGTEGDNHVVLGSTLFREATGHPGTILTSTIEHPAIEDPCQRLERSGIRVRRIPVDSNGVVQPADFERALGEEDHVQLVTLMLANNETGTIQPVQEVALLCRKRGIPIHTDAVNAFGKMTVDVDQLGVDLLTLSAHKFHGPKGAGLLYVRNGTPLAPLLTGGGQERNLRPGTESVAHAVAMAEAMARASNSLEDNCERMREQTRSLAATLSRLVPGARHSTGVSPRLPNTLSMILPGVRSDDLVGRLDAAGVAVSAGAACHAGETTHPSRVLLACGLTEEEARCTVRISLSRMTTEMELTHAQQTLEQVLRPGE